MSEIMHHKTSKSTSVRQRSSAAHYLLAGVVLVGIGTVIGSVVAPPSTARGEIRQPPPPAHFLDGDQLSLPILKDISATLRQIDARLARIEAAAKQMGVGPSSPLGN